MKLLTLILWFGFASMGSAQSASVTSGEHDGFSRLVVTFSKPVDWTLARTEAGYTLSTKEIIPRYDLSDAFRRLTSKRIAKLQRDPEAGSLILTLECNCYAIPFELRSGVLVIDIKDGRAPEGSSFEFAMDGKQLPPLSNSKIGPDKTIAKPVAQHTTGQPPLPETFTSAINNAARIPSTNSVVLPTTAALEEVRDKLLWQLGKGATTGVVEIADSISHKSREPSISQNSTNIRVGQDLGIEANTGEPTANHMTGNGKTCLSNEELDISAWATEANVSSTFSQNTTGLVGEFDRPDPANITRAVKYLLALGFGAEGRALLKTFNISNTDHKVLDAIAHIIDLEDQPEDFFQNMEVCNTHAALWAVLAQPENSRINQTNIPSILRSFSGLPSHLRRHLGPNLAGRFLARNDAITARAIRDAILRIPSDADVSTQIIEAGIELMNGEPDVAEAIFLPLVGAPGTAGILATIALIQTQVEAGQEIDAGLMTTAEALLHEAIGGEYETSLREAVALSYASQDRFDEAFGIIPKESKNSTPIWTILADTGSDGSLLSQAIVKKSNPPPTLPAEVERKIAERLLNIGFPSEALFWLTKGQDMPKELTDDDRFLAAKAEFLQNANISALSYLDGLENVGADALNARIRARLADPNAIQGLIRTEQIDDAIRAARHQSQWSEILAIKQKDVWYDVAELAVDYDAYKDSSFQEENVLIALGGGHGALLRAALLLKESASARVTLDRLLSAAKW